LPPNIKKLDHPPSKKARGPQAPPEVHITMNIAPTPGVGGAMSYVVLQTPNPPVSALGPSHPEDVGSLSAPGEITSAPPPHRVMVRSATYALTLALAKCTETGNLLSTEEVPTLMDREDPHEDGKYMDSLSDLVSFGVHNAIDIYNLEECYLVTFGLDRGCAHNLHQFTLNKILVPLGLHDEVLPEPSIQVIENWRHKVEQATVGMKEEEDIENIEDWVETVEEDEIEEAHGTVDEVEDEVEVEAFEVVSLEV
jgi:hypothetical protein